MKRVGFSFHGERSAGPWLAGLVIGLASTELLVAWLLPPVTPRPFVPDPYVGFRTAPSMRAWMTNEAREFGVWFETNSNGNPDRERAVEKGDDVFRIAMLGDSMLEGAQVEMEQRFVSILDQEAAAHVEAIRKGGEVLNFGIGGYGPAQSLLYYKQYVRQFRADAVFFVFLPGNDIRNSSYELEVERCGRPYVQPFLHIQDGELKLRDTSYYEIALARHEKAARRSSLNFRSLALYRIASGVRARIRDHGGRQPSSAVRQQVRTDLELFDPAIQETDPAWIGAWRTVEAIIDELRRQVRADGGQFHVVVANGVWEVNPESRQKAVELAALQHETVESYDWNLPHTMASEMLERLGVDFTALLPAIKRRGGSTKEPLNFPIDGHYTPAGHRVVAEVLRPVVLGYADSKFDPQPPQLEARGNELKLLSE